MQVSKKKSAAIRKLTPPTNFKDLQSLIGLFSYFRSFISNFAKIARPFTDMLKPEKPFIWTAECQGAFEELKEKLCSEPILIRYCPDLMCILDCNTRVKRWARSFQKDIQGKWLSGFWPTRCKLKTR